MAIVEQTIEHKWSCFRRDNSKIKVSNLHLQSIKISRPNAWGTLSLDKVWPHTMSTSLNRLKQVMLTTYLAFDDVLQCIEPPQRGYVDVSASGKSRFPLPVPGYIPNPPSLSLSPCFCLPIPPAVSPDPGRLQISLEWMSWPVSCSHISFAMAWYLHKIISIYTWESRKEDEGWGEGGREGNRIRNEAVTNASLWRWGKSERRIRRRFCIKGKLFIWPWVPFDFSSDFSVQLHEDKLYFCLVPSEWWFSVVSARRERHWFLSSACSPEAAATSFTSCSRNRLTTKSDLPGTEMCNFREKSCWMACVMHTKCLRNELSHLTDQFSPSRRVKARFLPGVLSYIFQLWITYCACREVH